MTSVILSISVNNGILAVQTFSSDPHPWITHAKVPYIPGTHTVQIGDHQCQLVISDSLLVSLSGYLPQFLED